MARSAAERVAVVTDSTASLTADEARASGVRVVPLRVVVGGTAYAEGPPAVGRVVAEALRRGEVVTTSRPSPLLFLAAYRAAAEAGAESVVSVHLSGELSGTRDAARLGALQAPLPVTVVDSRHVGMGLGFAALSAAAVAADGADTTAVAAAARERAAATSTFLYVHTLDHLRRGGRIGAAQALVGTALAVKPLLLLVDGRIEVLAKVRTAGRAIAELERRSLDAAGTGEVEIAVHHLAAPDRANDLADRLRRQTPGLARIGVYESGSVVGAHVGPGMLGVVVAPVLVGAAGSGVPYPGHS